MRILIVLLIAVPSAVFAFANNSISSKDAAQQALIFPKSFVFGVANAPAQVEDKLDDIWLDWAKAGHVRAWTNATNPQERLQFWSKPDGEIDLAKQLGVGAFRMGVDWGRLMPTRNTFDVGVLSHYREILKHIHARNMKVMLTLSHHSVPRWVQNSNGWHNPQNRQSFTQFAKRMMSELNDDVDWWITFNEANVFALNAYTTGAWPPGETHSALAMLPILNGSSVQAIDEMAQAHNEIYEWAHKTFKSVRIGIAHNMAHYQGRSTIDKLEARLADLSMNWYLPMKIKDHMDFFGMNYYGAEWINGSSVGLYPEEEYSEAGRAIDTHGLYDLLKEINLEYNGLPIIITENGIADASDTLRPSYLIEHLAAVHQAISEHVPVQGYFVWTLTDNLEWSDGYCPRFGLVGINRTNFVRTSRGSFDLYKRMIATHAISSDERSVAWAHVVAARGQLHGFCRDADGSTALDNPVLRPYSFKDWRFKVGSL